MSSNHAKEILARFNSNEPAGEFYVDTFEARGGDHLSQRIYQQFATSEDHQHLLFAGHIGCGKSSELLRIAEYCEKAKSGLPRYFTITVDMDEFMDNRDVDMRDVLLSIVVVVARDLNCRLGQPINPGYWRTKFEQMKDLLLSDVSIESFELGTNGFKAMLSLKNTSREIRAEVRQKLDAQPESLQGAVNDVLSEARSKAKEAGYSDICLLVDGLDKIEAISERMAGKTDHEAFFIDSNHRLKGLRTHCVWTVPLKLVRAFGPELSSRYSGQPIVLPMIKTFDRNRSPFKAGIDVLEALIRKRFCTADLNEMLVDEARKGLIEACGGHPRHLVRLLEISIRNSLDEDLQVSFPIKTDAVEKAKREFQGTLIGVLYDGDWELLAALEKHPNRSWSLDNPRRQSLLEQNCVLEYLNGDSAPDLEQRWYAVHPLLTSLKRLQDARA